MPPRDTAGALLVHIRVVDAAGQPVPGAEVAAMPRMFTWSAMSDADRHRVRQYGFDKPQRLSISDWRQCDWMN